MPPVQTFDSHGRLVLTRIQIKLFIGADIRLNLGPLENDITSEMG